MIDPRLRVLQLVDFHGTVTAAAQALSYSPPAVSHQLKQLAEELGVALLVPDGRGVRLTEDARTLLRHAEVLFEQAELAYADLGTTTSLRTLTVCGFSSAASLLPAVASELRGQHSWLSVKVIQASPEHCLNLLLTEEADLAILPATTGLPALSDNRFDQSNLMNDPLDLLVRAGHPLTERPRVTLSDAADEAWIVGHPDGPYYPSMTAAWLAAGFSPATTHIIEDWDVTHALVELGEGVTLIPRMVRIGDHWKVARVALTGPAAPSRQIVSISRKGARRRPLIARALEVLESRVREGYPYASTAGKRTTPSVTR